MRAPLILLGLPGLFVASPIMATPNSPPAELVIEDRTLHPVAPGIFGQFFERPSWGGETGPEGVADATGRLPDAVEKKLAAMHAPVVRFPSGTDGDYIDWTDMIDLPGRDHRPITIGHQKNPVTNRFGFPEYFALAERLGWSTIVVANLRDALYKKSPLAEAAAHAAALVAWCGATPATDSTGWVAKRVAAGHPQPWRLAAAQVGNEGWFFWPPKPADRAALGLGDDAACADWLRECLVAYADAIHRVRPDLPLIADAPRPADADPDGTRAVWLRAIDHPDIRSRYTFLAAHAYAPLGFWTVEVDGKPVRPESLSPDAVWDALVAALGRFDAAGQCVADATAYQEIARLGFRAAVTEWNWNGWGFKKRFPQSEFGDGVPAALGAAGFLHGLMREPSVGLATQSMLLGTAWGITAIRVDPNGHARFLPQAEATRLIAAHHGDHVIASTLRGVAATADPARITTWWPQVSRLAELDALVTADASAWYVHLIHRHRTQSLPLSLPLPASAPVNGIATLHKLTGSPQATTTKPGGMHRTTRPVSWSQSRISVLLPPASLSILVVPRTPRPQDSAFPEGPISAPEFPQVNEFSNIELSLCHLSID